MIGLIGPQDSVDLALVVAEAEAWGSQLVARSYSHSREAMEIARELDQTCQVLLLTGRVPFELLDGDRLNAELHYISHSGADLYRCLARVLIDREGKLPRVTLDSIDEDIAADAFADLELPAPHTMPLPKAGSHTLIDTDEVVRFHREQIESGAAEIALTCLAEVRSQLSEAGVPVWRVTHTKATMRQALRNAVLSDELHRSRAAQPAVMLFRLSTDPKPGYDVYDRESTRLQVQSWLLQLARKNGGRLTPLEADVFAVTTNRGAVDTAIERRRTGHASLLDAPSFDLPVSAGAGIGDTYAHAEENARAALRLAQPDETAPVVFPDGRVSAGEGLEHHHLERQDITDSYLKLGEKLNMGALAARRLVKALSKIDAETVTARELGEAYGVQTRSARRLLAALSEVGFATEIGIRARAQAGRPQTLYRVDVRALVSELEPTESVTTE